MMRQETHSIKCSILAVAREFYVVFVLLCYSDIAGITLFVLFPLVFS